MKTTETKWLTKQDDTKEETQSPPPNGTAGSLDDAFVYDECRRRLNTCVLLVMHQMSDENHKRLGGLPHDTLACQDLLTELDSIQHKFSTGRVSKAGRYYVVTREDPLGAYNRDLKSLSRHIFEEVVRIEYGAE